MDTNAQLDSLNTPEGFSRHRNSLKGVIPASFRTPSWGFGIETRENPSWRTFLALGTGVNMDYIKQLGVYLTFDARAVAASSALALFPVVLDDDPYCCCRCSPDPRRFSLFSLSMLLNARRISCFWLWYSGTTFCCVRQLFFA